MNRRGFFGALAMLAIAPAAASSVVQPKLFPWQEDIIRQCYLLDGWHGIRAMDLYVGKVRLDDEAIFHPALSDYRRMPVGPVVPEK